MYCILAKFLQLLTVISTCYNLYYVDIYSWCIFWWLIVIIKITQCTFYTCQQFSYLSLPRLCLRSVKRMNVVQQNLSNTSSKRPFHQSCPFFICTAPALHHLWLPPFPLRAAVWGVEWRVNGTLWRTRRGVHDGAGYNMSHLCRGTLWRRVHYGSSNVHYGP